MGQAQSQSSGTGCEDCYGGDSQYSYGEGGNNTSTIFRFRYLPTEGFYLFPLK